MAVAPDWWRGAVLYQVYPRSFRDSSGDGIGDLPGLLDGIGHIASLGVDGLWICPFFPSPMKDAGYDVADYCGVDPLFGGLADFDAVLKAAHAHGLKLLVDMVWSHTSDAHPWFRDSRHSRTDERADWYVWADAKPDGSPPNNWLAVFGGAAWTWEPRRRQYYLHHFLPSQPALNLRNPAVLDALMAVGAFWLERGVDGFRLDACDFYVHDALLRDNPPRPAPEPPVNPFRLQEHRYDMAQPEALAVMQRIRTLMDRYPGRVTIAELSSEADPLMRAATYTGGAGERLHMAYTLRLMRQPFRPQAIAAAIQEAKAKLVDGWMCWAFSNHDVARAVSRWGDGSPACAKLLIALLASLKGGICLYQGEELGLTEAEVPQERLQDPYGVTFWPDFKGRDGCRTPLPWSAEAPNAGFSTAVPWLPIPAEHHALAVDRQAADPESVLNFTRRFLAWRKTQRPLLEGGMEIVHADEQVLGFERVCGDERLLCLFNCTAEPVAYARRVLPAWGCVFLGTPGQP